MQLSTYEPSLPPSRYNCYRREEMSENVTPLVSGGADFLIQAAWTWIPRCEPIPFTIYLVHQATCSFNDINTIPKGTENNCHLLSTRCWKSFPRFSHWIPTLPTRCDWHLSWFYKWGNWASGKLGNLLQVVQVVNSQECEPNSIGMDVFAAGNIPLLFLGEKCS